MRIAIKTKLHYKVDLGYIPKGAEQKTLDMLLNCTGVEEVYIIKDEKEGEDDNEF